MGKHLSEDIKYYYCMEVINGRTKQSVSWEILNFFDGSGTYNSTREVLTRWLRSLEQNGKRSLASKTGKEQGKTLWKAKEKT